MRGIFAQAVIAQGLLMQFYSRGFYSLGLLRGCSERLKTCCMCHTGRQISRHPLEAQKVSKKVFKKPKNTKKV